MACLLYRKGDEHTVRGVKCLRQKFEAHEIATQLKNGWFTTPGGAYEKKNTEGAGPTKVLIVDDVKDSAASMGKFMTTIGEIMSIAGNNPTIDELKKSLVALNGLTVDPDVFLKDTEETRNDLKGMIESLTDAITEMEKEEADALLEKEKETVEETPGSEEKASETEDAKVLTETVTDEPCEDCEDDAGRIAELKKKGVKKLTNPEVRELASLLDIPKSQTARISTLEEDILKKG